MGGSLEFAVQARLGNDGRVTASATAAIDGPVWDFERVRLEDLSMDVHAGTAVP